MYRLKHANQTSPGHIAVHDVYDSSTKKVCRGVQFDTPAGLQSYCICSARLEASREGVAWGITVGDSKSPEQTNGSSGSNERGASQADGSHGDADNEEQDRGLFDRLRIERENDELGGYRVVGSSRNAVRGSATTGDSSMLWRR